MYEFRMPKLGADMDEGTLVEWKVAVGGTVKKGAIIAEVETSKGLIDIEVFVEGTIETLIAKPNDIIPVGAVMAGLRVHDESDLDVSEVKRTTSPTPLPVTPSAKNSTTTPGISSGNSTKVLTKKSELKIPSTLARGCKVSPRARRLAAQYRVDLSTVTASGPDGTIVANDVENAANSTDRPLITGAKDKRQAMRSVIAAAMSRAKREIPHYYLSHEINVSELLEYTQRHNDKLGVTDRLLPALLYYKAIAMAAIEFPSMNGTYEDDKHTPAENVNLGIAISLRRGGGLMAPCLMDAANRPAKDLMRGLKDVVARTRSGGLRSSEMNNGTLTVSNLGDRGVDSLAAVIYPPQVALVGIGSVRERPWVVNGIIQAQQIASFSLAADHRVSDGHTGALFLRRIEELLADPDGLM